MPLRASLAGRVARLEKADAAACPVCNGNAIRMEWTGEAGALYRPHAPADVPQNYGAGGRTRTDDLLITNQLLYQLSYAGRLGG